MPNASWSFVAMEYYALILNRTYFLTIGDEFFKGKVCRGLTSIETGADITGVITSQMAVRGDLADPQSYVEDRRLAKPGRADFSVALADILSVEYTPKKKWGMGYYPHDGRVFVRAPNEKREFIILGNQSGDEIASRLIACVNDAKNR